MRNYAIILAAGKGTRMGKNVNKQFLNLKGKPMLYYTLKAFSENKFIDGIVLVLSKDEKEYCIKNVINKYNIKKIKSIVCGGNTRQESVFNGLKAAKDCSIVLIHDGARPFVDDEIIENGIKYATKYGACACGVKVKDTIKVIGKDGFSVHTPNRDILFSVQTPQVFKYDIILKDHIKAIQDNFFGTDDTMIVENYNHNVYLYEGNYKNIKITTPEDLLIGEKLLEKV